jgi:RimJ/RimL family protein N-acetyltransferase
MWLVPSFQNTTASAESVMLVLQYLFKMGYRRVEWRCDGHNVRARKAAHNFGFSFEGVLRKDSIVKKSNCDTVVFSVINNEWPTVRDHLLRKLP